MTIAILATGDELIHGDTLNTNGKNIAQILCSEGLSLGLHLTCSDKEAEIVACLHFLAQEHDIIIITGGLGPTTDDLTRFALSQLTNEPLIQHTAAFDHIKKRLDAAKMSLSQGHLQQCLFPANAQLLENHHGSAMGCYYQWQNKTFILLPGPPRECLPMFNQEAMPLLQHTEHSQKQILKWNIFGVAEGEIAPILETALAEVNCQTGYRWDSPYIEFKVRCHKEATAEVQRIIDPLLAPHIISKTNEKASDALRQLIATRQKPITLTDEATCGLLQSLLTRPGLRNLVSTQPKHHNNMSFHITGLDEYWEKRESSGLTELTIHYSHKELNGKETHLIPYRSASVLEHAAEWSSFRLFHLINQLHK